MKSKICCICGKEIPEGNWGNNPDGAMWLAEDGSIQKPIFNYDEVCCDECNKRYVVPGRIYKSMQER